MQEYLSDGNKNTGLSKLVFKARGRTLEIKSHKFDDYVCVGCGKNEETEEEFVSCPGFTDGKSTAQVEKYIIAGYLDSQ